MWSLPILYLRSLQLIIVHWRVPWAIPFCYILRIISHKNIIVIRLLLLLLWLLILEFICCRLFLILILFIFSVLLFIIFASLSIIIFLRNLIDDFEISAKILVECDSFFEFYCILLFYHALVLVEVMLCWNQLAFLIFWHFTEMYQSLTFSFLNFYLICRDAASTFWSRWSILIHLYLIKNTL